MQIIRSYKTIKPGFQGCAVTIGNFDGMHLGHQLLLTKVKQKAQQLGVRSCVVLFEPQPKEVVVSNSTPARLMSFKEKIIFLREFGIDQILCLRFHAPLTAMSAEIFVHDVLLKALQMKAIIVGHDFCFGHKRGGDLNTLTSMGKVCGFSAEGVQAQCVSGQLVSSTLVRELLQKSDFDQVAALLNRRYIFSGRVCHGQGIGKQIGFRTANLAFKYRVMPLSGVFAAEVTDDKNNTVIAAVCVGFRPFVGGGERLLEAHLLDYDRDLYGKVIHVDIKKRLRDQWDFPSSEALCAQISHDIDNVRAYFNQGG